MHQDAKTQYTGRIIIEFSHGVTVRAKIEIAPDERPQNFKADLTNEMVEVVAERFTDATVFCERRVVEWQRMGERSQAKVAKAIA